MTFLRNIIVLFVLIAAASECASASTISCNFKFDLKSISFGNVLDKKTIDKEFEIDGVKFKYHIEDTSNFNELNDYVTMENKKGHKMTYALSCY